MLDTDSMNSMGHKPPRKVSVYFPFYDVYADISTPRRMIEILMEDDSSQVWLDLPDQDYINPSCNRGSK